MYRGVCVKTGSLETGARQVLVYPAVVESYGFIYSTAKETRNFVTLKLTENEIC